MESRLNAQKGLLRANYMLARKTTANAIKPNTNRLIDSFKEIQK